MQTLQIFHIGRGIAQGCSTCPIGSVVHPVPAKHLALTRPYQSDKHRRTVVLRTIASCDDAVARLDGNELIGRLLPEGMCYLLSSTHIFGQGEPFHDSPLRISQELQDVVSLFGRFDLSLNYLHGLSGVVVLLEDDAVDLL